MVEPNKWHTLIENYLKSKNIKILKNTEAIGFFNEEKYKIKSVYLKNKLTNQYSNIAGDKFFLCTQSSGILSILKNSSTHVKNNWMNFELMKEWCNNTFYNGFGFQLHFDKNVVFNDNWCWSCSGDWTVIILPVSNWLKEYSKDKTIKTVWSCCIVDMDTKVKE